MVKIADGFDPDNTPTGGVEIRYTVENENSEDDSENEDQEEISLNPKSHQNGERIPQFVLIEEKAKEKDGDGDAENTRCGLGSFSPDWMQVFASKKAFMLVFSLLAVVQGMSWAYFTATITTLEKRFKISSQTAGIVMTGNELSQVLFSIIIAYYGSHGHRPRWIAVGVLFSALSCLLLASPHLFYGAGHDSISLTEEYIAKYPDGAKSVILNNRSRRSAENDDDYDWFQSGDELFEKDELSITTPFSEKFVTKRLAKADEFEEIATTTTPTQAAIDVKREQERKLALASPANEMSIEVPHPSQSAGKFNQSQTQNQSASASAAASTAKRNRIQLCQKTPPGGSSGGKYNDCHDGDESIVPLILIFLSQFVAGIGVLLFFSLGGPYLDDNVKKSQSPMLFGVTMSLRLIGPTLGFVFGSICLKIYISPSLTPIIKPDDPRWMGAWWLGWVVLGFLMMFTSFFIALFPRELPQAVKRRGDKKNAEAAAANAKNGTAPGHVNMSPTGGSLLAVPDTTTDMLRSGSQILFTTEMAQDNPIPKLSEMSKAVKSLLRNKINLYNNLSGVFYIFSAIGYWTYMPKYMETIFMQTAANAALVSGFVSIAFQAAGLLISGALISKFQPSARKLAAWNVFLGFLYVVVKIGFTQMGCNPGTIDRASSDIEGDAWNLTTTCNVDCNCKVSKMLPVCFKETNTVFYSACHAGCTSFENGTISGCSCLSRPTDKVTLGNCSEGCFQSFVIFLAVNAVIKLLDSSGRIGNMLVSYRCVNPKDKSLAIGLAIFLISIFAMLPAPIVFGAIIDSVCLVWGTKCGRKGNCFLYDGERLRYVFNLTAAAFTFLGAAFDCLVWYHVEELDLYDEDKNVALANAKAKKTKNETGTM